MAKLGCKITCLVIALCFCPITSFAKNQLAFPTAEGYGKYTVGGRGGKVFEVTNLNDSGEGSLRAAVEAEGPRTVVFRVSGTIDLKSDLAIDNPYITIAGQTAPGDGICLKRYPLVINTHEVIIRYIRVRFGDESGQDSDSISSRYVKNLILDHVSASWSVDETMSIYHCENLTVQWCMITESLFSSNHVKKNHGYGGIWGSNYGSYHHNLIAHHSSRNPRFASGSGYTDYRNNVVYNWGYNSCYGGSASQRNDRRTPKIEHSTINMVGNYYKPGPATAPGEVSYRIASPSRSNKSKWYIADNVMVGNASVTANNWDGGVQPLNPEANKLDQPWPAMAINQQTAEEAYKSVLDNAGATFPKRDAVDVRIIEEVRNDTATYEGVYKTKKKVVDPSKITGIIDSQNDVGGWPELKSTPAPTDTDHDGMPDEWEAENGLNPNDASDGPKDRDGDGYTNVEEYINGLVSSDSSKV